ncbi:MAG TPA: M4 family metallopeptidase [Kofleriaceae bacterium]|nr:M4 family metallopeptidase [Kofleriaceae bacterium]
MQDVADALAALPEATVLEYAPDGMPRYVVGEMTKVGAMQTDDPAAADQALRPMLPPVLAVMRLTNDDLQLRRMTVDEEGGRHFRYTQQFNGLPVIGSDLVVHVDVKGAVVGVNGTARGDISPTLGANAMTQAAAMSRISADARFANMTTTSSRLVYIQTDEGTFKAYEATVEGYRGANPARDKVYVDVDSGAIVADYPQIHFAKNRQIYSANNGTSLPGTLKRSEGQAASTDTTVNLSYDNAGNTYDGYLAFFNRDSYDNAGATLINTVHYSTNYCNAFWNGTQMVYGDGNSAQGCGNLAQSLDVTAHEMTHAVTERESGLVYSGEPGGINESFSDIFGAFIEAWTDGGKNGNLSTASDVWLIGDEVLPPALRYMCDPAQDGVSLDFWSTSAGNVDVHYSSGIGNLMFCLLSKGGTHPRGKSSVNVPAIGMDKAIRIVYKAQVDILTSTAKYANLRTAMEQAATALGYDQATKDAVGCAFAAVNVGTAPTTCGGSPPPPPPGDGVLSNGVPVTGISGATGSEQFWSLQVPSGQTQLTFTISGGTGDADMYVQFGTKPTTTSYQCRPYLNGNSETCTFTPPQAGTYYVMLRGYTSYSGVSLTGTYSATSGGDPYLTNGVPVSNLSGSSGSNKYFRIATPAGKTLTIKISGGSGDADLYTRFGSRPTTSTYSCRPYLNGNNETCTTSNTQSGDYYVMIRGYTSYSGVTLIGSF